MTATANSPVLSREEAAVLAAIAYDGAEARDIRAEGVSAQKRRRVLAQLARRGLVEMWPNAWGPEEPAWWIRTAKVPDGWKPSHEIAKGMLFDRYDPNMRPVIFIELTGEINEYGRAKALLKAGTHNSRTVWMHRYHLESGLTWCGRTRGVVREWSSKFACEIHGECSGDMVTTKKTCALCDRLLNRY